VRAETVPANAGWPGLATTIGVIATDATLTKAQCQKASGVGHDGLARALKPVHTLFDGDTLFTLATGERPAPDPVEQTLVMEAGADCVARAVVHALLAATSVDRSGEGGIRLRSWSDAFPSAVRD
jgi:putative pantetheine hydrolase